MRPLPNAESQWERSAELQAFSREEVERCLGRCDEPVQLLSGGLANINLRVGDDRVLRIYRRDASTLPKEAMLLGQDWQNFRSPDLLGSGEDFLVLEHVEHSPLPDTEESGVLVGRALAEIHTEEFDLHGDFDEHGAIPVPMPDFAAALRDHAKSEIAKGPAEFHDLAQIAYDRLNAQYDRLAALCTQPKRLHGDFKASNLHLTLDGELLVLDWEFAYAGPPLMDVGQLMRWSPSPAFSRGFANAYQAAGGGLPEGWGETCALFDLANLAGLLGGAPAGSRRASDVSLSIRETLGLRS
jgi:hypothetical protein